MRQILTAKSWGCQDPGLIRQNDQNNCQYDIAHLVWFLQNFNHDRGLWSDGEDKDYDDDDGDEDDDDEDNDDNDAAQLWSD